eukprot:746888-Hanusia_phi.AAC.8
MTHPSKSNLLKGIEGVAAPKISMERNCSWVGTGRRDSGDGHHARGDRIGGGRRARRKIVECWRDV